jgi:hypothetical protein
MISICIAWVCGSCTSPSDPDAERSAILEILKQERKAHFEKDIDLFISTFSDSVVSVYDGSFEINTPADNKARFGPYFKSVEFVKWDDMTSPVIDISDDGTMAYAVVQKQIVLTYPDTLGNPITDAAQYAWVSIYRKMDHHWKLVCNASTYQPR